MVQSLDDGRDVRLGADEPVVPASVIKVLVALAAETWFADGRLDGRWTHGGDPDDRPGHGHAVAADLE